MNKPTSFGRLHSSVYHGHLYLFYAIINLILISCDLLYSTNWTISYPSISLFLLQAVPFNFNWHQIGNMTKPTAANSHWLAALLSSTALLLLIHTSAADEAFSCPNGKLHSHRIHNCIRIHIQLEIRCTTCIQSKAQSTCVVAAGGARNSLRINQSVYNFNYTDRHEHTHTHTLVHLCVYGQNGCWAWARQIVFDFRRFNWFCLLSLAKYN